MNNADGLVLDGIFYRVPELVILQGIYLKIGPGKVCGLFGRNGSGKTTLIKVASGQLQASSGITTIDGTRLYKCSRYRRFNKLAYLPQEPMLPLDIAVGRLLRATRQDQLKKDDQLQPLLQCRVQELSGGERRYLAVALVLGLGRKYVLLDEPFTGVEPRIIDLISEQIEAAAERGSGVLITDHYHQYVAPLIDDAYVMWQKQCYRLCPDKDIGQQLERYGYFRSAPQASHTT